MKNLLLTICSIAVLCTGCSSHAKENNTIAPTPQKGQVPIYDKTYNAIVYIDYSDQNTIFTYDGDPVAYIETEDGDDLIYGFNGKLLGWYFDGVIYDTKCCAVGAKADIMRGAINTFSTHLEPLKSIKKIKPIKSVEELPIYKSVFNDSWSKTTLTEFFNKGK